MTAPSSNSPKEMVNAVVQLPVRSRIQPNMTPVDGTMGDVELLCGARKAAKPGGGFEGFDRI